MPRSRVVQATLLALVLVFAGAKVFRYVQRRNDAPFILWEFRAGARFTALEKSAYRQTKHRFICNTIVPSARLCEMRVTGIGGTIRVLVDARDRIAIVEFAPDSASPAMREESRRVAAEWNLIRAGASTRLSEFDTTASITRWESENRRWTAVMRYGRLATTPVIVRLADEDAVTRIGELAPLASYVLALNGLIESGDVPNSDDVDDVMRTMMFGRATDPANETPSPRAPSTPLALCAPERSDPVVELADGSREGLLESTKSLLDLAIPAVYPGARLALGDGTWVVDSTGFSERVRFGMFEGAGDGAIAAGISFPGRSAVAARRIEDGVPDRYCRAPAELLFARANADGPLAEAHRVGVDHEAIASDILTMRVSEQDGSGAPGHIRVRYAGSYAEKGWTGTIEWETVIAEDPPRATVRVPLLFAQHVATSEEARQGVLVVTGRARAGIELSTIEQTRWGFTTRTTTVPTDSTGALLGARILERLAATHSAP